MDVRFTMRWRKVLPGTTTLQTNCRVPIRDWKSTMWVERRLVKETNNCRILASLSSGNHPSVRLLSSTTPMSSWTCQGPMVLVGTVGTRRNMNTLRRVVRLPRQSTVFMFRYEDVVQNVNNMTKAIVLFNDIDPFQSIRNLFKKERGTAKSEWKLR